MSPTGDTLGLVVPEPDRLWVSGSAMMGSVLPLPSQTSPSFGLWASAHWDALPPPLANACLLRLSSGLASPGRRGGGSLPKHPYSSHHPRHRVPCLPSPPSCEQPESGGCLVSGTPASNTRPATSKVLKNSCFVIAQMNEEMNDSTSIL